MSFQRPTQEEAKKAIAELCERFGKYFLFELFLPKLRGGFFEPSSTYVKTFPIHPNPPVSPRKALESKVEMMMLALQRELAQAALAKQESLRQHSAVLDREIDALVYGLYGLTEMEIALVEGA